MKRPLILIAVLAMLGLGGTMLSNAANPDDEPTTPSPAPIASPTEEPVVVIESPFPLLLPPSPSPSPSPTPVDKTPRVGQKGPEIKQLEQRLADLHYMAGPVDGIFDNSTRHGLIAFQKVEGLSRTGVGDPPTLGRLATASVPAPKFTTPADHLEIDIPRQVVFVVKGGAVSMVLPTSTGSNKNFTNAGWTRRAVTPNGVFKISRKINAMRISPLGELYKPSYFNGGIAFHGSGSVPTGPASHGCVRLPMAFATWFFDNASPIGRTVYVYGGPTGENPQPTIDDAPAPLPTVTADAIPSPSPEPSPVPSAPCQCFLEALRAAGGTRFVHYFASGGFGRLAAIPAVISLIRS